MRKKVFETVFAFRNENETSLEQSKFLQDLRNLRNLSIANKNLTCKMCFENGFSCRNEW